MTPGHKLDALVAEKVMGWQRFDEHPVPDRPKVDNELTKVSLTLEPGWSRPKQFPGPWFVAPGELLIEAEREVPAYSTDIAAAWEVIEKISQTDKDSTFQLHRAIQGWACTFKVDETRILWPYAPTSPHAICLAALKAVGVEIK